MDRERIDRDAELDIDSVAADTRDVEGLLNRLAPAPSRLAPSDRDRLMYSAGEAAGRRAAAPRRGTGLRAWQGIAAALAITTGGLAWTVAGLAVRGNEGDRPLIVRAQPQPQPQPNTVTPTPDPTVDRPPVESPVIAAEPSTAPRIDRATPPYERRAPRTDDARAYLALRHVVLTQGVDALPTTPPGGATDHDPATFGSLRRAWNADDRL